MDTVPSCPGDSQWLVLTDAPIQQINKLLDSQQLVTFVAQSSPENIALLRTIISQAEQQRAMRFFKQGDRNLSIVAHGLKRMVLANLLDIRPQLLTFKKSAMGKPFYAGKADLAFNISHAGDWTALAIARTVETGVDIEFPGDNAYRDIADACLTAKELEEYAASGYDCQYFLKRWTQKESITKAVGCGLFLNFNSISLVKHLGQEVCWLDDVLYNTLSQSFYGGFISAASTLPMKSLNIVGFDQVKAWRQFDKRVRA